MRTYCSSFTAVGLGLALVLLATDGAMAATATYPDFSGYVIRVGGATAVSSDPVSESFTVTAVSGGKVAIGTSAMNGLKVSAFQNFSFTNSVTGLSGGKILYPNAWITDGTRYAFLAMNYSVGAAQTDDPVYNAMVSPGGMATVFDDIGLRVYATGADVNWIYPGAVKMAKGGSWTTALWKTSDPNVYDPVRLSDIGDLLFGSPFTTTTVPGISPNSDYSLAGTGDPQMPHTFYLMAGDTSGSVENDNYTLSDLELVYVSGGVIPEPLTMLGMCLGLGSVGAYIRKRRMR